jgi:hypothetical protein
MLSSRRRVALHSTAAVAALAAVALTTPAQAVTAPNWITGTVPVLSPTCTLDNTFDDPTHLLNAQYTDSSVPAFTDVWLNSGNVVVLAPGAPTSYKFRVRAVDQCSGVGLVQSALKYRGSLHFSLLAPETTNVLTGTWSTTLTASPSDAGLVTNPLGITTRRYDQFHLGSDFELISKTDHVGGFLYTVGPWSTKRMYFLDKSTITNTLSATKVAKGKTVKASAVLSYAGNAAYLPNAGGTVLVQTKVGTGRWLTNATLVANAAGAVSYSFVLTNTTAVRFIHPRSLAGRFTEAVTSPIKVVAKA